jgi:MoxR-like ATPase
VSVLPLPAAQTAATDEARAIVASVEQVVRGRRAAVELVVCAALSGGHVLIEDVPGSGKTTLARAVARALGGSFRRVQGTSDLLPADITGSMIWNPAEGVFSFAPGPLFAHVLLVDELNRIPPRTQSALLEAMDESAVTVDGNRYDLPQPFVLLATQNPVEHYGTYPLPDAQLDRFTVLLSLGANDGATERRVVREQLAGPTVDDVAPATDPRRLMQLRAEARGLHVADAVLDYAVTITNATRSHPMVALGASTRAALALVRCAQARALLDGRPHVLPDDIKALAGPVLAHRLVLRGMDENRGTAVSAVAEVVAATPAPLLPA